MFLMKVLVNSFNRLTVVEYYSHFFISFGSLLYTVFA